MPRPQISAEELFYDGIYTLVSNLLINNVNYKNGYHHGGSVGDLIDHTKERASYILERMEHTKHLIIEKD